jgi:hypothetical protein
MTACTIRIGIVHRGTLASTMTRGPKDEGEEVEIKGNARPKIPGG